MSESEEYGIRKVRHTQARGRVAPVGHRVPSEGMLIRFTAKPVGSSLAIGEPYRVTRKGSIIHLFHEVNKFRSHDHQYAYRLARWAEVVESQD